MNTSNAADSQIRLGGSLYRAYVLGALLIIYVINFLDRVLIGVLGEPIRQEFGLSDWQIGLLSGPAFAFIYTFLGIPIAVLAERYDRRVIIAVACALWSGMTLLCGLAATPLQFALARIGVGVGEAGCTPPSHALISDYYPKAQRARAMSIYTLGIPLGIMLASLLGVYVAKIGTQNWRFAFMLMGGLGLIIALIFAFSVRDPRQSLSARKLAMPAFPPMQSIVGILRNRAFMSMAMGGAIVSLIGYGGLQFTVPFWTRVHGLPLSEAALLYGVVLGLCAGIGTLASGWLSDRLVRHNSYAYGRVAAFGFIMAAPCYVFGYNTLAFASGSLALWLAVPAFMLGTMAHYAYLAPMFTLTQNMVTPDRRATAAALLLFIINMVGYVCGPPLIGALSDAGAAWYLAFSGAVIELPQCDATASSQALCMQARAFGIRLAMSLGTLAYGAAAICFWRLKDEESR